MVIYCIVRKVGRVGLKGIYALKGWVLRERNLGWMAQIRKGNV